ncbi:hypothetical protein FB45DRAFT_934951 [Roridomyces roridus]|uniref:Uncharacterized protein n=1 Tax=Roridomyces roridus TaxID=1738132 RepID=A0AAD7FET6_9AGAR|nr:hypothetical protein FB45DRAFT_934951 [Roridomyces roridus]
MSYLQQSRRSDWRRGCANGGKTPRGNVGDLPTLNSYPHLPSSPSPHSSFPMRVLVSLLTFFALFFTLTLAGSVPPASTPTNDDTSVSISFFRPWTWTLPLPALGVAANAQADAAAAHVRRHGPRRRAVHP